MIATKDIVSSMFDEMNKTIFASMLSRPTFKIKSNRINVGAFTAQLNREEMVLRHPTITITDYYDFTERELRSIIAHEMVHFYLIVIGDDLRGSHGDTFKKLIGKINRTHNLEIAVAVDPLKFKRGKVSKLAWHIGRFLTYIGL